MEWPLLIVAAACAVAAIVIAFWVDRDRARRRQRILASPPHQPVLANLPSPEYLTEADVRAQAERLQTASDQADSDIRSAMADVKALTARLASDDFITDTTRRQAILLDPVVWIAQSVATMNDLFEPIRLARRRQCGLVIAVGQADPEVVRTLAVNVLAGTATCLLVVTQNLDQVADRTGGTVLSTADAEAGYMPATAIGHCRAWIADLEHSWIIV
ncbi:MAG: hypothetical protein LBV00_03930 [Propionibacteriaceae bacterium]|jgi:hypothetical protein|nr:hypothetical protein [Propionibacteriaceae bacterium]